MQPASRPVSDAVCRKSTHLLACQAIAREAREHFDVMCNSGLHIGLPASRFAIQACKQAGRLAGRQQASEQKASTFACVLGISNTSRLGAQGRARRALQETCSLTGVRHLLGGSWAVFVTTLGQVMPRNSPKIRPRGPKSPSKQGAR